MQGGCSCVSHTPMGTLTADPMGRSVGRLSQATFSALTSSNLVHSPGRLLLFFHLTDEQTASQRGEAHCSLSAAHPDQCQGPSPRPACLAPESEGQRGRRGRQGLGRPQGQSAQKERLLSLHRESAQPICPVVTTAELLGTV